ncbi:MAG TPA: hypothetical protein VL961_10055 [Acidimicrobiales bacterium]|nr:hypothetical protein [Acidimicrobiales bacterium]
MSTPHPPGGPAAARYAVHGLAVDSDIALGKPHRDLPAADVTLRTTTALHPVGDDAPRGTVVAELALGAQHLYTAVDDGDRYVLRIHSVCDFVIDRSLEVVECQVVAGADPELVSLLVRGALLAFLLGLGGACVLHASAVESDGGSVAFAAGSGMGKSTVAALACRDGARFVCDDLLRLSGHARPRWVGRSSELRLRAGAVPLADAHLDRWSARDTVDGRVALTPPPSAAEDGVIDAVVIPAPTRTGDTVVVTPLGPVEATLALSAFPRLMWTLPSALGVQFDGVSRLASSAAVLHVTIPWGPPFAPGLGAEVVRRALDAAAATAARSGGGPSSSS